MQRTNCHSFIGAVEQLRTLIADSQPAAMGKGQRAKQRRHHNGTPAIYRQAGGWILVIIEAAHSTFNCDTLITVHRNESKRWA
jgi:hypothetical protein